MNNVCAPPSKAELLAHQEMYDSESDETEVEEFYHPRKNPRPPRATEKEVDKATDIMSKLKISVVEEQFVEP